MHAKLAMDTTAHRINLDQALAQLRLQQPGLRAIDTARKLGISEAELLQLDAQPRLRNDFAALLQELPKLGRVMVLCRNHACVHERFGCYEKVHIHNGIGVVLGPDIDLRLFLNRWASGFSCTQQLPSGERESLQFFDDQGGAVHKIYRVAETDSGAWHALRSKWQDASANPLAAHAPTQRAALIDDAAVDLEGLRKDWKSLQDTHDFHDLMARHQVQRPQAYRLVGEPLAYAVSNTAVVELLQKVSQEKAPIMAFVGNGGAIQIHTGPVEKLAWRGNWFNILDTDFNLHLNTGVIAQTWIVRKPTRDGIVSALELYSANGEQILQLFGARKPGQPELPQWRRLLGGLLSEREHELTP